MRAIVDTRVAEALTLDGAACFDRTYLACKDKVYTLSADGQSGHSSLQTWVELYQSVMNAPIALDLTSAAKMSRDIP